MQKRKKTNKQKTQKKPERYQLKKALKTIKIFTRNIQKVMSLFKNYY